MKEHPIIFSTPMVQAILAGRKTMTRRIKGLNEINERPNDWLVNYRVLRDPLNDAWAALFVNKKTKQRKFIKLPYGWPGDRLWVKETFTFIESHPDPGYVYKADDPTFKTKWTSSLFMSKAIARIRLKITDVKLERLKSISKEDAIAEGITPEVTGDDLYENYAKVGYRWIKAKGSFKSLWEKINGEESWDANPWVWVISFKKI